MVKKSPTVAKFGSKKLKSCSCVADNPNSVKLVFMVSLNSFLSNASLVRFTCSVPSGRDLSTGDVGATEETPDKLLVGCKSGFKFAIYPLITLNIISSSNTFTVPPTVDLINIV